MTRLPRLFARPRIEELEARLTPTAGYFRIADYNIASSGGTGAPRAGLDTILQGIGNEPLNSQTEAIDLLTLEEVKSQATTTADVVALMNSLYGAGMYSGSNVAGTNPGEVVVDGTSTGAGTQGVVYNAQKLQLLSQKAIGTTSAAGIQRQPMRYVFHPIGYPSAADFCVYVSHTKASQGTTEEGQRQLEAQVLRADADTVGYTNIIYTGDFNTYTSSEPFFTNVGGSAGTKAMYTAGNGQAIDPINRPGTWHNGSSFNDIFTQAPSNSPPAGFTSGGLDDRFDFELITAGLNDGIGLDYVTNTYHTFAINGSIPYTGNASVNDPSNTALPTLANRTQIFDLLTTVTDHLPVVADYRITPLTVTIDQKATQADPSNSSTINFTVVFNQSVSDFATGDVSLTGTAGATTAVVTGSGTTYNVAVSGMSSSGTVIASLAANVATRLGYPNLASTSTDNNVTYDKTVPTAASSPTGVTVAGANNYQFTVTYSDNLAINVGSLDNSDVRVTGPSFNVPASLVGVDVAGNGTPRTATYKITPPGGTWDYADNGSYSVVMQASQVTDTAGNNVASGTLGSFNVTITPPTVTGVTFGDGTNQRSTVRRIVVTFSEAVNFMGDVTSAFTVHRAGTGGAVGNVTLASTPATGPASSVTVTFSGSLTESAGSLIDGLYDLTIGAAQVSGSGGALDGNSDGIPGGDYSVTGTTANMHFRFFGDVDGNATVDQNDYLVFRNALSGGPSTIFDFDNSGDVDQLDYLQFRNRVAGAP
ncbi:MAG: hypothetical protein ACJ8C4_13715 [Gemmataceae bacterium]